MLFPSRSLHLALHNMIFMGGTVVFLVAFDTDSLAALHIMTTLLKSENTAWEARAMRGYHDVQLFFTDLARNPNPMIHSVVMLNCGGSVDLVAE